MLNGTTTVYKDNLTRLNTSGDCAIAHDPHMSARFGLSIILCTCSVCAHRFDVRVCISTFSGESGAVVVMARELCCSEMMQLFVIVLAMNEIRLII